MTVVSGKTYNSIITEVATQIYNSVDNITRYNSIPTEFKSYSTDWMDVTTNGPAYYSGWRVTQVNNPIENDSSESISTIETHIRDWVTSKGYTSAELNTDITDAAFLNFFNILVEYISLHIRYAVSIFNSSKILFFKKNATGNTYTKYNDFIIRPNNVNEMVGILSNIISYHVRIEPMVYTYAFR